MTKKELLKRIEELEKRVAELEAQAKIIYPYYPYHWWQPYTYTWTVTAGNTGGK